MERKVVVVDASVVVKWFVEEEFSEEARMLRDAYVDRIIDLAAPSLLPYEVLNALKYSGAFGEEELIEISNTLRDFQITLYELLGKVAEEAVRIAMRKGVTIYDASYVSLARHLNTVLYTADNKLVRKIDDKERVKHIMEFEL